MKFTPKNYSHLIGLKGFSNELLTNHFKLYEGYVENTSKLFDVLAGIEKSSPEYAELKRRFGWEFNGVRLHELYFGNLAADSPLKRSRLKQAIEKNFGSHESWEKDFRAVSSMRGIGWAALMHDPQTETLFNVWINEHDTGILAGAQILLILDAFEHAYMIDYGIQRKDYISAFLNSVKWEIVSERFEHFSVSTSAGVTP